MTLYACQLCGEHQLIHTWVEAGTVHRRVTVCLPRALGGENQFAVVDVYPDGMPMADLVRNKPYSTYYYVNDMPYSQEEALEKLARFRTFNRSSVMN